MGDTAVEACLLVDNGVVLAVATAPGGQVDCFTVLQDPGRCHQSRTVDEAGLLLGCEVHKGPPSARKYFRCGSLELVPISRTNPDYLIVSAAKMNE